MQRPQYKPSRTMKNQVNILSPKEHNNFQYPTLNKWRSVICSIIKKRNSKIWIMCVLITIKIITADSHLRQYKHLLDPVLRNMGVPVS